MKVTEKANKSFLENQLSSCEHQIQVMYQLEEMMSDRLAMANVGVKTEDVYKEILSVRDFLDQERSSLIERISHSES